ncbi:uncharacterized protein LOC142764880 [Rhipicephalus microplus]|uniref:uncharacterized protein LOC142764880 n=1 Tax=Rhipicephalus microplus TaxID=6941 RepID=UPI003F6B8E59
MIWRLLLFCSAMLAVDSQYHQCFTEVLKNQEAAMCAVKAASAMRQRAKYGGGAMLWRGRRDATDGGCFNSVYGLNNNCFDSNLFLSVWLCLWDRDTAIKENIGVIGISSREQVERFARAMRACVVQNATQH